jgi:formate dehydrogenase iron-sulfur subunit
MSTNRREFMRRAGVAGVAALVGNEFTEASPVRRISDDWMGMLTDLSLCVGCRKCEWACRKANGLAPEEGEPLKAYEDKSVFEQRRRTDAKNYTVVDRPGPLGPDGHPIYVKKQCMHCNEPACASACLVAAFTKTPDGPVLYNEDVCIGCRYCMIACPFYAPGYSYDDPFTPAVKKCTMCAARITEQDQVPACAEICPEGAITFGKRSDLIVLAREKIREAPDKYVNHIYGEYEVGGTSWLYISPRPFEELGFRTDLDDTPRPALTKAFLSAVPMVLIAWPALLMGSYAFTNRREETDEADQAQHSEKESP